MGNIIVSEGLQWQGSFYGLDVPESAVPEVKAWLSYGNPLDQWLWSKPGKRQSNILVDGFRQKAVLATFGAIDRLVITNQTSAPNSAESNYTGAIYTSVEQDEFSRTPVGVPYKVIWVIGSSTANGNWGSYVLIDSTGAMINRALAGTSKTNGQAKFIEFQGNII